MAILRGDGAMTDVNLIARTYFNATTKDGKTQFLDVQVDHRDQRGPGQANLHLRSEKQADGKYNNGAAMTSEQFAKIREAAGANALPVLNKDQTQEIGRDFAFKASIMPSRDNKGLVVNTNKPMGPSDFKLDGQTMTGQFASMKEASKQQAAERAAAQASAPAPEAEAPQAANSGAPAWAQEQSADADQPSVG